jgi:OmcA/MtrC family decaheme c-type cytochrome
MITGGIGYTYGLGNAYSPVNATTPGTYSGTTPWSPFIQTTQPLTQTNVVSTSKSTTNVARAYAYNATTMQGGVSVPARNIWKLATVTAAGKAVANTARRAIVSTDKCNDCHAALGVFTESVFHAGQRNDAETCTLCHNVNRVNSGWGVNIKEAVHSIHAGGKREQKFSWERVAGAKYWEITYPNALNKCEACHIAGTYDFSATTSAAALSSGNLLWTTVATDIPSATATNIVTIVTGAEPVLSTDAVISPWISKITDYGKGFSYSSSLTGGKITDAVATTLVSSPIASACFACHDGAAFAVPHMKQNGGKLYAARSTVTLTGTKFTSDETCMGCHGSTSAFKLGIKEVHSNFK